MRVYVDIDETICYYQGERNYELALPINSRIEKINQMHDDGHEIFYWTARGTVTGKNWYNVTREQLSRWGCKYHSLSVGEKPNYDLLICDKAMNSETFFSEEK
tara:strand:+ start:1670 stop:1978 length:309 start_codon:yes stop_codon:yes gene_type:complete